MNISFNNSANRGFDVSHETNDASRVSGLASATTQSARHPTTQPTNHLTITRATTTPEEIAAAEIPESALTRDDALVDLIGRAFNLPPPPMPDFTAQ